MRKIIQIAVDSQPESQSWGSWTCITGLCDDGTVWELDYCHEAKERKWTQIPAIPQDDT